MVVFRAKCGQSGNLTEGISCVGYICVVVFAVFVVRRGGGVGVGVGGIVGNGGGVAVAAVAAAAARTLCRCQLFPVTAVVIR